MHQSFIQLINHLTRSNAKNGFAKPLKLRKLREVLSLLTQQINIEKYKTQLDALSLELIALGQQTNNLDKLIKKYQELISLILIGLAGSSSEGAGAKLQMSIISRKNSQKRLIKIVKEINKLLEEGIQTYQNPCAAIGELVANIIIGIFSFFVSDLEKLDEQTKKELNKELTTYKQQQKSNNIITQINLILDQLRKATTPAPIKSTKQAEEKHFFPNPFMLTQTPSGNSTTDRK